MYQTSEIQNAETSNYIKWIQSFAKFWRIAQFCDHYNWSDQWRTLFAYPFWDIFLNGRPGISLRRLIQTNRDVVLDVALRFFTYLSYHLEKALTTLASYWCWVRILFFDNAAEENTTGVTTHCIVLHTVRRSITYRALKVKIRRQKDKLWYTEYPFYVSLASDIFINHNTFMSLNYRLQQMMKYYWITLVKKIPFESIINHPLIMDHYESFSEGLRSYLFAIDELLLARPFRNFWLTYFSTDFR